MTEGPDDFLDELGSRRGAVVEFERTDSFQADERDMFRAVIKLFHAAAERIAADASRAGHVRCG